MIAALYVEKGGVYYGLPDVDPWDEERDARLYAGPWPVVAHPPCERWGRYWNGGPSARIKRKKGDDDGCFKAAIEAVRKWGGVLEHPAESAAWFAFGLRAPLAAGRWWPAGDFLGFTAEIEQGHYGHRARKRTWLYAVSCRMPDIPETRSIAKLKPASTKPGRRESRTGACQLMSKKERAATPIAFRDLLLGMARSVKVAEASEAFNDAVKKAAEKAGVNSGPLKKLVVARCKEKTEELTREQEQLALMLFATSERD